MFSKSAGKSSIENFTIKNKELHGAEVDLKLKTHHLGQLIFNTLKSKPEHVAQIEAETGKQTSFSEMKYCSIRCALWLKKQGICHGDIITICSHNHLDTYIPVFATFYLGAIHNAWNDDVTLQYAQHFMNLLRPKVIFACHSAVDTLLKAAKLENVNSRIIVFGEHPYLQSLNDVMRLQSLDDIRSFVPREIEDPEKSIAAIQQSSGSSGWPKGVVHSYESLINNVLTFAPAPMDKVTLSYSNLHWTTCLSIMLQTLLTGGTRVIHGNFDAEETCKVIEMYEVHFLYASAIMIGYLCKLNVLKKYRLESLRFVLTSGTKVNQNILGEFKARLPNVLVVQGYGLTETTRCVAVQTAKSKRASSVGFVVPNAKLKIFDSKTGEILGPNQEGELCVKTPHIMLGYYKNLEKTREAIDEEGWLHSGDKAYYDDNGEVIIVGRLSELMKFDNHHVFPTEIEEVLLTHSGIAEVAVVPMPYKIDDQRPIAFVKKIPEYQVSERELVELSANLGEIKTLWAVMFLEDLPKTASGKVSKSTLKEMAKALASKE